MPTNEERCEGLVNAGIITENQRTKMGWNVDDILVEDWTIAGACLERIRDMEEQIVDSMPDGGAIASYRFRGLCSFGVLMKGPTAIIDAFLEAVKDD